MIRPRLHQLVVAVVLATRAAAAQAPAAPPPLAQIKDDDQLEAILRSITQDPAIAVDDPATRSFAHAAMTEGVKQLRARAADQALASFLQAYARFPSPRILLVIAATLRDLGRLADAANTYQRYLNAPSSGPQRITEIKELLSQLDERLTILTVRVVPRGAEVSIDGGPFIRVGSALVMRVGAGAHLARIRKGERRSELTVNGVEGEVKEVTLALATAPEPTSSAAAADEPERTDEPPDRVDGWLITGTQSSADRATGRDRRGGELAVIAPRDDAPDRSGPRNSDAGDEIGSGAIGVLRIDGKGRGFAGGLGLAISRGRFETELMVLKSHELGGYLGLRYRLLSGWLRPYVAAGVPGFAYDHAELQPEGSTMTTKRLAIGARVAAGIELVIGDHLSVQADLGYEHFFFIDDHYEADVFVPTLGVIGRL